MIDITIFFLYFILSVMVLCERLKRTFFFFHSATISLACRGSGEYLMKLSFGSALMVVGLLLTAGCRRAHNYSTNSENPFISEDPPVRYTVRLEGSGSEIANGTQVSVSFRNPLDSRAAGDARLVVNGPTQNIYDNGVFHHFFAHVVGRQLTEEKCTQLAAAFRLERLDDAGIGQPQHLTLDEMISSANVCRYNVSSR